MVLLGAIDQGTSSSRFLIFDSESGEMMASHQVKFFKLKNKLNSFHRIEVTEKVNG
jgi:glycerol kinase